MKKVKKKFKFTRSICLHNNAFNWRMKKSTNSLNGDTGEETKQTDISIQNGMDTKSIDRHWSKHRSVFH